MRKILLALALVAMFTVAANAETRVWWEVAAAPGVEVVSHGPLQTLGININDPEPPLLGDYSLVLTMYMSNDAAAATQGMTGYRTQLWRTNDTNVLWAAPATGPEANLNPFAWTGTTGLCNINTAGHVFDVFGRSRGTGQPTLENGDGAIAWITFTLALNGMAVNETRQLRQTVATGLFATLPPTANTVRFGPNAGVSGATAVNVYPTADLPVISVTRIPEPGTLMLLGLGLVGLIRRR